VKQNGALIVTQYSVLIAVDDNLVKIGPVDPEIVGWEVDH